MNGKNKKYAVNCQLSTVNCLQKGLSTLEMLIAMALIVLVITAVLPLVAGGQSTSVDSQTNQEALYKAQQQIENARATARADFNDPTLNLGTTTTTDISGITYTKNLTVALDSANPDFSKIVTSQVTWGSNQQVTLSTTVADWQSALSNVCNQTLTGDWKNPVHYDKNSTDLVNQATGNSSNGFAVSDVKVFNHKLYITANDTSNGGANLWISDLPSDISQWQGYQGYKGSIDTNNDGSGGLQSLVIARINNNTYAFVANTDSVTTKGHLQVIDVTNPTTSGWNPTIVYYPLPTVSSTKHGNSIFYDNGYIYLGLTGTANSGTEFNIIDVHTNPLAPNRIGGYSTGGHDVNSIFVKNNLAYIVTPNSENMTIIDVDVNSSTFAQRLGGSTNLTSGGANGESVFANGNAIYLGRTFGANEFYVLNAPTPATISVTGSQDIGSGSSTTIYGLSIRQNLAFFMTKTNFQVWDITDPTTGNIKPWTTSGTTTEFNDANHTLYFYASGSGGDGTDSTLNCSGNYFYAPVASAAGNHKDTISIIGPGASLPSFDYALSNSGNVTVVRAGATGSNTITVTMTPGATPQAVTITPRTADLPSGVTVSPASLSCTPSAVSPYQCTTSVFTYTAASNANVGGPVTINIDGANPAHSTSFDLTVNAPAFNYNLTNTGNVVVTRGSPPATNIVTVTMTVVGAIPQSVTLSNSILPIGVTVSYSPISRACTPSANAPYQCTISLSFSAPLSASTTGGGPGPMITVTGTSSGGIIKTTTFRLKVQ